MKKNPFLEMYEKEKIVHQKWLDENRELKETTGYAAVQLKIALLDVGIVITQAFDEAVEKIKKVKIHHE